MCVFVYPHYIIKIADIISTSIRIRDELRFSYDASLTIKIIDFVIFFEPAFLAADKIAARIDFENSINHSFHDDVRYRPIAVSIKIKTESRTTLAAKEQLSVWIATQITRIELLLNETALGSDSPFPCKSSARSCTNQDGITTTNVIDPGVSGCPQ